MFAVCSRDSGKIDGDYVYGLDASAFDLKRIHVPINTLHVSDKGLLTFIFLRFRIRHVSDKITEN